MSEPPDFNEEPFLLGSFDELVNFRGGRAGRAQEFMIGSQYTRRIGQDSETLAITNTAMFDRKQGQPSLKRFVLTANGYEFELKSGQGKNDLVVRTPEKTDGILLLKDRPSMEPWFSVNLGRYFLGGQIFRGSEFTANERNHLSHLASTQHRTAPYAAAPIRAQPRRTYELLGDTPRPQGEHVPMLLAEIYGQQGWEELREPLESFARAAGLFDEITVRRLGKNEGSPFQIYVKLGGPARNLVDVGYGVSQILPLLVDLLRNKEKRLYLIQQPEVHLHPRAQAELSPLLGAVAKANTKQLLIETHSDYIIDRFRIEVRAKRLKPSDVIVLYFEGQNNGIAIYPLRLDERGNLLYVPPTYRQFFLDEEKRFLGVG